MKTVPTPARAARFRFSLGGSRSLTILIAALTLFVAGSVYFVNRVVISPGTDQTYYTQAEAKASLITFNTNLLKQAQAFSTQSNDTALPAGRTNPFAP